MTQGQEKSALFIIALKPTNKPGRLGAELGEPRERTEGNMGEQHTYRTLCRIKRAPEPRLCTRSCSWDSSLTTRGGSPVRESRPPGSVRGASSNGCPYRDTNHLNMATDLSTTTGDVNPAYPACVEHGEWTSIPLDPPSVSHPLALNSIPPPDHT